MSQIIYDLVYRDKGKKASRQIKIDFVSRRMQREIQAYIIEAGRVAAEWTRINNIITEIASLRIEKPEGYKQTISDLEKEKQDKVNWIVGLQETGIQDKSSELLIQVLKDNDIKDENMLSMRFWDECVEPSQIIEILVAAVNKGTDLANKKKVIF